MNEVQIFKLEDRQLRVQKNETGDPLWCPVDLCKMLGIQDSAVAKRRIDPLGVFKSGMGVVTGKKKNGEDAIQHFDLHQTIEISFH